MSETLRKEGFVERWSRVKREVVAGAVPPGTASPVVPDPDVLPSLESIATQGLEADFSAFMQAGVEEGVRRAAVQQLFRQPIFNVMDGLDVYIEDFNVYEPLLAADLPGLAHARSMLFPEPDTTAVVAAEEESVTAESAAVPAAESADETSDETSRGMPA